MATQKFNITSFKYLIKKNDKENDNKTIFYAIKKVLNSEEEYYSKLFAITEFMLEITNIDLLESTLTLFKEIEFKLLYSEIGNKINFKQKLYSEQEVNRIYAIVYANFIRYSCLVNPANIDNELINDFKFSVNFKEIIFTDNYTFSKLSKHIILNAGKYLKSELEFKRLIKQLSRQDLINDSNTYKNYIEFLQIEKNNLESKDDLIGDESQDVFKEDGFKLFLKWDKVSKEDKYHKYSFIFKRLQQDDKLRKSDFKTIVSWLQEHKFIGEEKWIATGHFITPVNILTKGRNILFDSIELK